MGTVLMFGVELWSGGFLSVSLPLVMGCGFVFFFRKNVEFSFI